MSSLLPTTPTRPQLMARRPPRTSSPLSTPGVVPISTDHRQTPARPPSLAVQTHVKAGLTTPKLDGSSKDAAY